MSSKLVKMIVFSSRLFSLNTSIGGSPVRELMTEQVPGHRICPDAKISQRQLHPCGKYRPLRVALQRNHALF